MASFRLALLLGMMSMVKGSQVSPGWTQSLLLAVDTWALAGATEVICREGDIRPALCTILKLIMAELSLLTEREVCLGCAGFLGVLGNSSTGVGGGVSGTLKQELAAVEMGMVLEQS